MTESKRMKSDQVRREFADVLQFVRQGGSVIVEHYNRPVARITKSEDIAAEIQRAADEGTIEHARQILADAEAKSLVDLDRGEVAERAIRLEIALKCVLDVIDRRDA